jgi:hypothetical protein
MNKTIYTILFLMISVALSAQNYIFDLNKIDIIENKQEVILELRTNSFEALNFFNQSKRDFKISMTSHSSNKAVELEPTKLISDQLSQTGSKEWHIIFSEHNISNEENLNQIKNIYNRIRKANLCNNAFTNIYTLGKELKTLHTDFNKLPPFDEVATNIAQNDHTVINLPLITGSLKPEVAHIVCFITDGELGEKISEQDLEVLMETTIKKFKELKDDILFYPIFLKENKSAETNLNQIVDQTNNGDDEIATDDISPIGRQKDGTSSKKDIFNFKIYASPLIKKGETFAFTADPVKVNIGYSNSKTNKTYGVSSTINTTHPADTKIFYQAGSDYKFINNILIYVLISLLLIGAIYMIIPMINRYKFKQKHVFTYQDVRQAKTSKKDPLTLEEFHCDDKIVIFGEKMMLLETWKYLNKKDNIETAKDYSEFFRNNIDGNIFTQTEGSYKWAFLLFFSIVYSFIVFTFYKVIAAISNPDIIAKLLQMVGLENIAEYSSVIIFFVLCNLAGLVVFHFQNKFQSSSFYLTKHLYIPILIGCIGLPTIYISIIELLKPLNSVTLYASKFVFFLLLAINILIASRHLSKGEARKYLLTIAVGTITALIVHFMIYNQATLQFIDSPLAMFGLLATTVFCTNFYLNYSAKNEVVKLIKILSPDGYSGTKLPLDIRIKNKWSIGNNPQNDIYIKWLDYEVKNDHCYIEYKRGNWIIYPYNSEILKNGTLINNETNLALNDVIALGKNCITQLKFVEDLRENIVAETPTKTNTEKNIFKINLPKIVVNKKPDAKPN